MINSLLRISLKRVLCVLVWIGAIMPCLWIRGISYNTWRSAVFPVITVSDASDKTTIRRREFSTTPTWDVEHGDGSKSTVRERPFSSTPTWDVKSSDGSTSIIRQQPFSSSPTLEQKNSDGSSSTTRLQPFSSTPTWEQKNSDGTSATIHQRPFSTSPTWDLKRSDGGTATIRERPFSSTPTWEVESEQKSNPLGTIGLESPSTGFGRVALPRYESGTSRDSTYQSETEPTYNSKLGRTSGSRFGGTTAPPSYDLDTGLSSRFGSSGDIGSSDKSYYDRKRH